MNEQQKSKVTQILDEARNATDPFNAGLLFAWACIVALVTGLVAILEAVAAIVFFSFVFFLGLLFILISPICYLCRWTSGGKP